MTSLQTKPVGPQIGPPKPKTTIQQDLKDIRDFFQNFLDSIKDFFQGIGDFFKSLFGGIGDFFKDLTSYRWFVVIVVIFIGVMLLKKR